MFQRACIAKFSWDSLLLTEYRELCDKCLYEPSSLERGSASTCGNRLIDIHGFCDSSAQAYCAVVSVRVVCSHGVEVNLWARKCRVAPMKDLSIPRLELLAWVLLSKLVVSAINAVILEAQVRNVFCWTDSQIAVWWIKQSNKRWNVWMQNRVEILRNNISSVHWFHIIVIPKSSWHSNSLHSIA